MHAKFDQWSNRKRSLGKPKLDGSTILKFNRSRIVLIMGYIKVANSWLLRDCQTFKEKFYNVVRRQWTLVGHFNRATSVVCNKVQATGCKYMRSTYSWKRPVISEAGSIAITSPETQTERNNTPLSLVPAASPTVHW